MKPKFSKIQKSVAFIMSLLMTLTMYVLPISAVQPEESLAERGPTTKFSPYHDECIEEVLGDGTNRLTLDVHGIQKTNSNVVLIMDFSSSMRTNYMDIDGSQVQRLKVLEKVSHELIDTMYNSVVETSANAEINMAIVIYAGYGEVIQCWTDKRQLLKDAISCHIEKLKNSKMGYLQGNTNCQAGIVLAETLFSYDKYDTGRQEIKTNRPTNLSTANNVVVFITDGSPNRCFITGQETVYRHDGTSYVHTPIDSTLSNADRLEAEIAVPCITYSNTSNRITAGESFTKGTYSKDYTFLATKGINKNGNYARMCSGASQTDYRKIAVEAALRAESKLMDRPEKIQCLSMGLGEWFKEDTADSTFRTSINFLHLLEAISKKIITFEEAVSKLGPDVSSGAMPGNNPPYPILLDQPDSYYSNFGLKIENESVADIPALKAKIVDYFGDVETQKLDGIYDIPPLVRPNGDTVDIIAETWGLVFSGDTYVDFKVAFEEASVFILTGYTNVKARAVLTKYVTLQHDLTTEDMNKATYTLNADGTVNMQIKNPSVLYTIFFKNAKENNKNNDSNNSSDYVIAKDTPASDKYEMVYILNYVPKGTLGDDIKERKEGSEEPTEVISLEFKKHYILRHGYLARMYAVIKPTQYAWDTLYNNVKNSYKPPAMTYYQSKLYDDGESTDSLVTNEGIDPAIAPSVTDTGGYPNQAFWVTFKEDSNGNATYGSSNGMNVDQLNFNYDTSTGEGEYGFWPTVFAPTQVRYYIVNTTGIPLDLEPQQIDSDDYLTSDYDMPVIKPKLVNLPVKKIWNDADEGGRPQSVDVTISWDKNIYTTDIDEDYGTKHVLKTGTEKEYKTVTLTQANNWEGVFENLPCGYDFTITESGTDGEDIIGYNSIITISEYADDNNIRVNGNIVTIENPTVETDLGDGVIITNTTITSITVIKDWDETNRQSGSKPQSALISLYKDGDFESSKTISETSTYMCMAPVLNYVLGNIIDFTTYDSLNSTQKLCFSNYYATWDDLPKYNEYGERTLYIASETVPDNYSITQDYTHREDGYIILKNTYGTQGTGDLTVVKCWHDNSNQDGIRPQSVTITLYETTNGQEHVFESTQLNEGNLWYYKFSGLSSLSTYRVEETETNVDELIGYTTVYSNTGIIGGKVPIIVATNTHVPETADYTVIKHWNDANNQDGLRLPNIGLCLKVRIEEEGSYIYKNIGNNAYVTLGDLESLEENSWSYTWTGLPKYKDGVEIIYSGQEITAIEGYTTTYTAGDLVNVPYSTDIIFGNGIDTITITNTHTPYLVDRTLVKNWNDNGYPDKRTGSINVQLYADGQAYGGVVTLSENEDEEGNWSYTWTDLPRRSAGNMIEYTVREAGVNEYLDYYTYTFTDLGNGIIDLTNTIKTTKTVIKSWNDTPSTVSLRPKYVYVQLYADNKAYFGVIMLENSGTDTWTYTWDDLPKYDLNGNEITYTVKEIDDYYTISYGIDEDTGNLTILNTPFTSITIIKHVNNDTAHPSKFIFKIVGKNLDSEDDSIIFSTHIVLNNNDQKEIIVPIGSYEISEIVPSSCELTYISGADSSNLLTAMCEVNVTEVTNRNPNITFTNTFKNLSWFKTLSILKNIIG